MEISIIQTADRARLTLKGRLDASWADHVGNSLEAAIRNGAHHLELDCSEVAYLSSAGIRILLIYFKKLATIKGTLQIPRSSEFVAKTLKLAGFESLLQVAAPAAPKPDAASEPIRLDKPWGTFQIHVQSPDAVLRGATVGNPDAFFQGNIDASHASRVSFPAKTLGLGLGAFGTDISECRHRFGEFLAVDGAAITLPTDGSTIPDYVVADQQLVPELCVIHGLTAYGRFARMMRFDSAPEGGGTISLAQLVETAIEVSSSPMVAVVALAECGMLVGASLRRSPLLAAGEKPMEFPHVRNWLTFTTERSTERHVALVVGVAGKTFDPAIDGFLRPIGPGTEARGHFHAALFPYRPLQRGELALGSSVGSLLATHSASGLLHLLSDDRPFEGVGQSELFRGACWTGPLNFSSPNPGSS